MILKETAEPNKNLNTGQITHSHTNHTPQQAKQLMLCPDQLHNWTGKCLNSEKVGKGGGGVKGKNNKRGEPPAETSY